MCTIEKGDRTTDTTISGGDNCLLALELSGSLVWFPVSSDIAERWRVEFLLCAGQVLVKDGVLEAALELFRDLSHGVEIQKSRAGICG